MRMRNTAFNRRVLQGTGKGLGLLLAVGLVVFSFLFANTSQADDAFMERFSGEDRYETAAQVAQDKFESSGEVIIARGDEEGDYADALGASVLAGAKYVPILLTEPENLPEHTSSAIDELEAEKAVVMGGTGAISAGVEAELEDKGLEVERHEGARRYETAARVARQADERGRLADHAFIVNAEATADALIAGSAAYRDLAPVLQVEEDKIPAATEEALADLEIEEVYLVGGSAVISSEEKADLEDIVEVEDRLFGADRYETSVDFAEEMFPHAEEFVISGGPDGHLVDAIGACVYELPILYVQSIPEVVQDYLDDTITRNTRVKIMGGTAAVSNTVERSIRNQVEDTIPDEPPEIYEVTFPEHNKLEDVEITIYETWRHEQQVGEKLVTDEHGVAAQELKEDRYWFKAELEYYETYEDSFELDGADKNVYIDMEKITYEVELVSLDGEGKIRVANEPLSSEEDSVEIEVNEDVTIEAVADPGWKLDGWSEDASDERGESFDITVEEDYEVGVEFEEAEVDELNLEFAEDEVEAGEGNTNELQVEVEDTDRDPIAGETITLEILEGDGELEVNGGAADSEEVEVATDSEGNFAETVYYVQDAEDDAGDEIEVEAKDEAAVDDENGVTETATYEVIEENDENNENN